jgi:hypothetical protein
MTILKELSSKLNLSTRLENVVSWFLYALIQETGRFTLKIAADISGLDSSQFSRLLSGHTDLALDQLNRFSTRLLKKGLSRIRPLVSGGPWNIAVIIDATLQGRSSSHVENSQKFNHGQGWVIGHQWTNIVLWVGGVLVPLPPIPFHTKQYCKDNGLTYETEHERIMKYLKENPIMDLLPDRKSEEVVFLMDAGYDNKKLQRFIVGQGHDFVGSLKKTRSTKTESQGWHQVWDLFYRTRKNAPWKTIRIKTDNGKQRRYRIRELSGQLKGILSPAKLICSEKPNGENIYLACSNEKISARVIVMAYRKRWMVEIFHHDIKSLLGFEDLGVHGFDSMKSYIYWVYLSYQILEEEKINRDSDAKTTQKIKETFIKKAKVEKLNSLHFLAARFDKGISVREEIKMQISKLLAA